MSISNASSFLDTFAAAKNKFINGDFSIWNRGNTINISNAAAYTADRWSAGGASASVSRQSFTPGSAPVSGYESPFYARYTISTNSQNYEFQQYIESGRTFAGQTMTFSFWALTSSSITFIPRVTQNFGSGGSPSAEVLTYPVGGAVTVGFTNTWTRYSYTFQVPSVAGKTFGTTHDGYVRIGLQIANTATGSVDFWGWQAEAGAAPTSFTTCSGTAGGEALLCQRYLPYFGGNVGNNSFLGFSYSTTGSQFFGKLPVTARTNPTGIVISNLSHFYVYNSGFSTGTPTGITWNNGGPETFTFNAATTAGSPTISQNQPVGFVFNNTAASMYLLGCEF